MMKVTKLSILLDKMPSEEIKVSADGTVKNYNELSKSTKEWLMNG